MMLLILLQLRIKINLFLIFPVACPLLCEAGYTLNVTACTCVLSNICQLITSPCQNGGSCTLVSAPSNYICDCTGTGYQGVNCSACKLKYNQYVCTWVISDLLVTYIMHY